MYNILVGGAAGEGSKKAGLVVAQLMSFHGYKVFIHEDYQSLIKGGHNFSLVRATEDGKRAVKEEVDVLLALNEDTIERHKDRLKEDSVILYDSESAEGRGVGVPLGEIVEEAKGIPIMKNTALVASFAKVVGMSWEKTEEVLKRELPIETEKNLEVAKVAYDKTEEVLKIEDLNKEHLPIISGSEAVALGALRAGMSDYYAYPMTPSTGILHFLSTIDGVATFQPESELSTASAAIGAAYAGRKTMVGTSGGGFALMTESVSLSAQAETPLVVALSQRAGPATGVPTYTAQADLLFTLFSGHGDMTRYVVAPGDAEEAYELSAEAMNVAWTYRLPAIILLDKELAENSYSFTEPQVKEEGEVTSLGKVTGYEHTDDGISTEDPQVVQKQQDRRLKKHEDLLQRVENSNPVKSYGEGEDVLLVWGSNKGIALEVAEELGLRVVQLLVFQPFPKESLKKALEGARKVISMENNSTGQGAFIMRAHGARIDEEILKYDARPFTVNDLKERVKKAIQ